MNKNNTSVFCCDKTRYLPINKYSCIDTTSCLIIPVTIHHVCPNSHILVVVEVYSKNKLYSRKIKKIFTGSVADCDCKSNCYNKNEPIEYLFVDNFKFYFINYCNIKYINVDVNIQYIYDC